MVMEGAGPDRELEYLAYVSEPITRCPPREKGRISNLVKKIQEALAQPPYGTRLYIPSLVTSPGVRSKMRAEDVYLLDRIRVVESDFMLVVADHTSFGIGGEVEMATSLGKPVIIFSRSKELSRFLIGTPSNAVRALEGRGDYYLPYRDWRDLKLRLLPLVEKVIEELKPSKHGGIPLCDVGKQIRETRRNRQMSIESLAQKTGLRPSQLEMLEKPFEVVQKELAAYRKDEDINLGAISFTPHQVEELANIGLPALHKIAVALEVPISSILGGGQASIKGAAKLAEAQRRRISELRTENLMHRAAQYDVTFREYQKLHDQLVKKFLANFIKTSASKAKDLQVIQQKDFIDALAQVRGTGPL